MAPTTQLQRLSARHQHMVDMWVNGLTVADISQDLGLSKESVGRITGSALFQDAVARRRAEQRRHLDAAVSAKLSETRAAVAGLGPKAVATLDALLDCDSATVRLNSVKEILNRAFGGEGGAEGRSAPASATVNIALLTTALRESEPDETPLEAEYAQGAPALPSPPSDVEPLETAAPPEEAPSGEASGADAPPERTQWVRV